MEVADSVVPQLSSSRYAGAEEPFSVWTSLQGHAQLSAWHSLTLGSEGVFPVVVSMCCECPLRGELRAAWVGEELSRQGGLGPHHGPSALH